ncbi:hypothetical protein NDU88_003157 [Pleurodeles waltl]|uniref:Uncharacterized protein n=1 Tax=Pleurodeles waltl TaxID=8319 RepID=A0AAV7PG50_PLEWA|nr:hypothetical protein NDU88_003157 [Pleurodeles waltl]
MAETATQQDKELRITADVLGANPEYFQGRSRRNNISVVGVPKKTEETAVELFVRDLILKVLQPWGVTDLFSVRVGP